MPFQLHVRSQLAASPEQAWAWITSVHGISAELRPWLRMSVPAGVNGLGDLPFQPGRRLFRSRLFLFGVLPVDHSDLTLLALTPGVGFVEQSPMGSMHLWRHERRLDAAPGGCVVEDRLTFEPRWLPAVSRWCVHRLFAHRHAVLRRHLGAASRP